ncbi:MAG: nicotinate (nicotinamide) nucleotide adenylyltransferase [Bacteroidales bacterium]|nr:nicotinate (nicotinamide) nucleotide adenylyltransferase [Bacteroidales bacterium]
MNIAVYSGSFNPLHIGHLAIMKHMTDEAGYDYVYLVVSPKNPLKDGISSDSGRKRYEAAVEAVCRHPELKVWVDDIELEMTEPHYTIRTLDALQEREPENSFTLVMGADNLADIRRWKDYRRILKDYGVAVFPRNGFELKTVKAGLIDEDSEYRIRLLEAEMVDISSTIIRNAIASGEDASGWLM